MNISCMVDMFRLMLLSQNVPVTSVSNPPLSCDKDMLLKMLTMMSFKIYLQILTVEVTHSLIFRGSHCEI